MEPTTEKMGLCMDCRFWEEAEDPVGWYLPRIKGQCHYNPPHTERTWPMTNDNDWCSKWKVSLSVRAMA
jgi:hypothetical protein